jgi:hypothetical protein
MNRFAGKWTYRSFYNLPKVERFDELKFAEAELTLEETERADMLTGRLSFGAVFLRMTAFVGEEGGLQVIRMRGDGVDGTTTAGWTYDYVGHLSHPWQHAELQRPAIVGTVVRTRHHEPQRVSGLTASFIAVHQEVPPEAYKLPDTVVGHFAGRMHRLHHAVWHGIRNTWDIMDPTVRRALERLDWATPRPSRAYGPDRRFKAAHVANGSGEDFLFFHRQMIVAYERLMAAAGKPPVEWTTLPEPGADTLNAVPELWHMRGNGNFERRFRVLKSDEHYWTRMRWWDQQFKNPVYLATLTLGELGSLLEFSIHNDMHIRWTAAPRDPLTREIAMRADHDFTAKWELPVYDWLGEFYASHVNPVFWRLHGWIDDRIDDWFQAHEARHPGAVRRVEKGGVAWFEPGPWVQFETPWVWPASLGGIHGGHGGHDHGSGHGHHAGGPTDADRLASLEVVRLLLYPPPSSLSAMATVEASPVAADDILRRALSPVFGASDV